jgi:uncharacterized protein YecE (DUF72 family)
VRPALEGLGAKCGPLLLQFPPLGRDATRWPARFAARLADFLAALPKGPLYAVEVRDKELVSGSPADALARLAAGTVRAGHPVFVTANNKAEGSAPLTVFELGAAIRDALAAR